jgi:hypothetical protein
MSHQLRMQMIDELQESISRKDFKFQNPGRFFDTVDITLTKRQWTKQWKDSYTAVLQDEVMAGSIKDLIPPFPWKSFVDTVSKEATRKRGNAQTQVFVKKATSNTLVFEALRAIPMKKGMQQKVDIEEKGLSYVKEGTTKFFNSGPFKKVAVDERFNSKAGRKAGKKYQEYEHGDEREPYAPDIARDGAQATIYSEILNNNPSGAKAYLNKGGTVSGSAGTRVQASILKAIIRAMTVVSKNNGMYGVFFNAVVAKFNDLFQLQTKVNEGIKPEELKRELIIRGELIPVLEGNAGDSRWNSGKLDVEIRKHYENFLSDNKTFIKEVQRLMGLPLKEAELLWISSPRYTDDAILHQSKLMIQNMFTHKTSPNMRYKLNKVLTKPLRNINKKGKFEKQNKGKGITNRGKKRSQQRVPVATAAIGRATKARSALATKAQTNPMALKNLINSMLPQVVAMKMQSPRLRYRTGRFANSARVTQVMQGPRGGLSADYTYMRNPYETFEPGGKMGSTQRDPRRIIGQSIREIVAQAMQSKFIKTRRV